MLFDFLFFDFSVSRLLPLPLAFIRKREKVFGMNTL